MENSICEYGQNSIKKYEVYKNKSVINIHKSNLIDFISNSNKFNLNSAFDHKGAKSFLKSKEKALKKIIIDDNLYDEKCIKSPKKKTKYLNLPGLESSQENIRNKSTEVKEHIFFSNVQEHKAKSGKNVYDYNDKYKSSNHNEDSRTKKKERKKSDINKKSTKFCSQIELKMYNDKQISKLKPIKVKTFKNIKKNYFSKIESRPSDSTIINLIQDMSN